MYRHFLIVFVLLNCFFSYSQKAEIIQRSAFKHDYAIGYSYYVEDNIDTSKLYFVGVVKVISSIRDVYVVPAISLLNSKTKELSGNAYRLKTSFCNDTTLTLAFDVYFAPQKYLDLMKQSSVKEKIVLFNNYKDTTSRTIVVNSKSYSFPKNTHFEVLTFNEEVNLKLENDSTFPGTNKRVDKNEKAVFLTIRKKNMAQVAATGGAIGGFLGAVIATEAAAANPRNNSDIEIFAPINYNTGRVLLNLYPVHNQIKTH